MKRSKSFFFGLLSAVLLLLFLVPGVSAEHYSIDGYEIPIEIIINNEKILTNEGAFLENGITYVPVRPISEALGASVTWEAESRTASVTLTGVTVSFSENAPLPENAAVVYENTLFVPVRTLAEALGLGAEWDENYYQVHLTAPTLTVSDEYVDQNFRNSDVLLIAQVLQCECGSSPFEGKIAVANIITNRVAHYQFPSTVKEVIYDRRGGSVQFPLAYNGRIDNVPSTECILAAKCALAGVVVAKDCLFFQADWVEDSWLNRNRTYAMSSGGNAFFN